jgi:CRISPR-associated protein Cmr2
VLYSEQTNTQEKPEQVKPIEALQWLLTLQDHWKNLQNTIAQDLALEFT